MNKKVDVEIIDSAQHIDSSAKHKLFLNKKQIKQFKKNLKIIVDAILVFIENNVEVKPIITTKDIKCITSYAANDIRQLWLQTKETMTIRDLVVSMIPDEKCKTIADAAILDISIDQKNKQVQILQNLHIENQDIDTLSQFLSELLFEYYATKLIIAKEKAALNLQISKQSKQHIARGTQKVRNRKKNQHNHN